MSNQATLRFVPRQRPDGGEEKAMRDVEVGGTVLKAVLRGALSLGEALFIADLRQVVVRIIVQGFGVSIRSLHLPSVEGSLLQLQSQGVVIRAAGGSQHIDLVEAGIDSIVARTVFSI